MVKEEEKFKKSNLFEGIVSLRSILKAGENGISDRKIKNVFYSKERAESSVREYTWLKHTSERLNFNLILRENDFIDDITVGNSHGGIAFECGERSYLPLDGLDLSSVSNGFYVMLDGIEDPYNFGYAVRTLYAAGVIGLVLTPRNWMSAAGVVCRASAGASELLPIYVSEGALAAEHFHKYGYKVVCADLRDAVPVYDAGLKLPLLLIVGGEKRGVSRAVLDTADIRIKLDYAREFEASLSAASAASVIAYEIYRQNR